MLINKLLTINLIILAFYLIKTNCCYSFNEELLVELLPNSNVHFFFQFKTQWNKSNLNKIENYDLFPKRFGDIVSKFQIEELSLTLSQGTWKYNDWGVPSLSAPSGSELWTIFNKDIPEKTVDTNWLHSSRAVSGLFGLSINLEDNPNTVSPLYSIKSDKNESKNLKYASIPNEIVCTENLTPWLKLLPCGKNKGLAQLFKNSPKLFESHYFMASLNFRKICLDTSCSNFQLELKQTLSLVYNVELAKRQYSVNELTWSVFDIFQNKITGTCPVSDFSNVYFNLGSDGKSSIQPTEKIENKNFKAPIHFYDLKKILADSKEFNPNIVQKKILSETLSSLVSLHRYITDKNEINFGLKTLIKNNLDQDVSIVYFDSIPWYFRVYINSLIIKKDDQIIKPELIHFEPGLDRKKAHHIEIKLTLKKNSIYSIYFRAEYAYLKWDEFPPDVNHGFYINPSMIVLKFKSSLKNSNQLRLQDSFLTIQQSLKEGLTSFNEIKIYSETLLMNLPTPDFSMPYNVICLTCTVVAIAFGSLHNFTTKKFKFIPSKTLKDKLRDILVKLKLVKN